MALRINDLFFDLIEALEVELRAYQTLSETCRQEKEVLISAKNSEIRRLTEAKENLMAKIREVDLRRDKVARELSPLLGISEPRLKLIVEKAPQKEAAQLRALQTGLEIEVNRIKEINEMNGRLIGAALENVRGALNSIKGSLAEKPIYKKEGSVESKTLSGQFVSREA